MGQIFGYFLILLVVFFMILDIVYLVKKRNSAINTNSVLIYTLVPVIMILLSLIPDPFCYIAIILFIIIFMFSFMLAERISLKNKVKIDVFNIKADCCGGINEILDKRSLEYSIKIKKANRMKIRIANIDKKEVKNLLNEINEYVDSTNTIKEKRKTIIISMVGYIIYIAFISILICTGLINELFV